MSSVVPQLILVFVLVGLLRGEVTVGVQAAVAV